jgi:hypothetical protein
LGEKTKGNEGYVFQRMQERACAEPAITGLQAKYVADFPAAIVQNED